MIQIQLVEMVEARLDLLKLATRVLLEVAQLRVHDLKFEVMG